MTALGVSARSFLRSSATRAGLEGAALTSALSLWPGAGGRGVIFTLHHVRPAESETFRPNGLLSITPEFLAEAIEVCRESGLTAVALEDLPRLLADPADSRRFACFTLDDGYRNNAEHAAPVFRRHGVPYTIFVTEGFAERRRSMWWETAEALTRERTALRFDFGAGPQVVELRTAAQKLAAFHRFAGFVQRGDEDQRVAKLDHAAREHGIDPLGLVERLTMSAAEIRALAAADPLARFGAHTVTHVNLRRVGDDRLREEIAASARAVERYTGRPARSFAYPYGFAAAACEREFRAVAEAGFAVAVTTRPGVIGAGDAVRPTAFRRVSLNGWFQKKRYVRALVSGIPFKLM